jgi:hypothetical protein
VECWYDVTTGRRKDYNGPHSETEVVRFKDQGLIKITTPVNYGNGIPWPATYIAASRYHGRDWQDFLDIDIGLPSPLETAATSKGVSHGIHISTGDSSK